MENILGKVKEKKNSALFARSGERVDQHSAVRVSRLRRVVIGPLMYVPVMIKYPCIAYCPKGGFLLNTETALW
ncbi:hypothetical protein [Mucilaginibacter ginsenosidivorans]|uniref:hypothetical protein n=1 Tax=Mucilaginibacter ginsenosidivorans TaxID=398053 RepID=UPI001652888E|nr:hypothetical protein [Mucilaginibacter ginsenosidivorans]